MAGSGTMSHSQNGWTLYSQQAQREPRFLRRIGFPQRNIGDIGQVLERIVNKAKSAMGWSDSRSSIETQ